MAIHDAALVISATVAMLKLEHWMRLCLPNYCKDGEHEGHFRNVLNVAMESLPMAIITKTQNKCAVL